MARCRVRWSDTFGAYLGSKITVLTSVFVVVYLVMSLVCCLTFRLYVRGYYHGAHMAGLSVFIAAFVLSHHFFKIHAALGCGALKPFFGLQVFLNVWFLLCALAAAVAYCILTAKTIHTNFDYVTALVFCWIDVILLVYLVVLSFTACCTSWHFSFDVTSGGRDLELYQVNGKDSSENVSSGASSGVAIVGDSTSPRDCLRRCCNVVFWLLYILFHILFAIVIFLTAYHPATVLDDLNTSWNKDNMYTVNVDGHRPLALYLKCRGNGSDTIVYENGLGGMALMQWDFIPKHLESQYTVCVHDRRGYGWSEGYEYDYIDSEEQWAGNNVEFFRALVKEAGIQTPFYYVGHSYGGIHLAYTAYLYPELVKGLVFLDTALFSAASSLQDALEVISNFQPLGLLRAALDLEVLDFEEAFKDDIDFSRVSDDTVRTLIASIRSGYYAEAYLKEWEVIYRNEMYEGTEYNYPAAQLNKLMKNDTIAKPALFIDAGYKRSVSSSTQKFLPLYRDSEEFNLVLNEANHQSLVYGYPYSLTVANIIDKFIQYDKGTINRETYAEHVANYTA